MPPSAQVYILENIPHIVGWITASGSHHAITGVFFCANAGIEKRNPVKIRKTILDLSINCHPPFS